MAPGVGIFKGNAGDNRFHKHSALQITLSLNEDKIMVDDGAKSSFFSSVIIPPNCTHRIEGEHILSIYVDSASSVGQQFKKQFNTSQISMLSDGISQDVKRLYRETESIAECLYQFMFWYSQNTNSTHKPRLDIVLNALEADLVNTRVTPLREIAALTGLSASRFSHWFKQQTGSPLRTYRKWLRLIRGVRYLLESKDISAAASIDFSDQAHFSRTLKSTFGITPKQLIQGISIIGKD